MMDDISLGLIDTVITKDMSRLGRDHIKTGEYTDIFFPTHRIRYIAINDGYDSANQQSTYYGVLKQAINEFYSRDNSVKIKAAFKTRAKAGKYHATAAPFGYLKDPKDHNHLIPDPETAPYVVKIYKLRELSDREDCEFVLWNGTKRLIKRKKLDEFLERAYSI